MDKQDLYFYFKFGCTVLITVAICFFIFNQYISYRYKTELLMTPCEVCVKANPEWNKCYDYFATQQLLNRTKPFYANSSNFTFKIDPISK